MPDGDARTVIEVRAAAPYAVVVGTGLLEELAEMLPKGVLRVAVLHPRSLARLGGRVRSLLSDHRYDAHAIEVPDGEAAKTADVASFCWRVLGETGFTRSDAVVTVGGGATTDLGGFVAATWLRGVAVLHVPASLLGMVDAAVGGKTGINTAQGKNLVGVFHEPAGVLCDLDVLETLPRNELVSGMAEVVKCGFVADPAILELIEADPEAATRVGSPVLRELVERSIRVKAEVVSADLRETGGLVGSGTEPGREVLNYGHTLGHAIERVEGYHFRHGAAVAIGMVYAAELAGLAGLLDDDTVRRHRSVLGMVGLPTTYPAGRWEGLRQAMRVDKKARGDRLRFVVLDRVAHATILTAPDAALLAEAYAEVSA